jgi:TRAP-type C4-dicarboxylate transport system substrate-binding protein
MAPEILVMSRSRWTKLDDADRELVRRCARESVPYMRKLWDARVAESERRVLEAGVKVNEVEDVGAFSELMRPVWDRFITSDRQKQIVAQIEAMGPQ